MKRACFPLCSLLLLACHGGEAEPTFPLSDGTSVPLPLECRVQTTEPGPHRATFTLRNTGTRSVFLSVDYGCGFNASLSSCARGFKDDFFSQGVACPCEGNCPVGGPGCAVGGRELAPGASANTSWEASITIFGSRNGERCARGSRNLPAGRYRLSVNTYASAADATARMPVLFTVVKDFELPAANQAVEIPFSVP